MLSWVLNVVIVIGLLLFFVWVVDWGNYFKIILILILNRKISYEKWYKARGDVYFDFRDLIRYFEILRSLIVV